MSDDVQRTELQAQQVDVKT